eukprot:jgi/Psemu1/46114/gm1.46114_g
MVTRFLRGQIPNYRKKGGKKKRLNGNKFESSGNTFKGPIPELKEHVFTYTGNTQAKQWLKSREAFIVSYVGGKYDKDVRAATLTKMEVMIITAKAPTSHNRETIKALTPLEAKNWEFNIKECQIAMKELEDNLGILFDKLWSQCDLGMQNNVKSDLGWKNAVKKSDVIELLEIINKICSSGDQSKYTPSLTEYHEEFDMLGKMAEQHRNVYVMADIKELIIRSQSGLNIRGKSMSELSAEIQESISVNARNVYLATIFIMNLNDSLQERVGLKPRGQWGDSQVLKPHLLSLATKHIDGMTVTKNNKKENNKNNNEQQTGAMMLINRSDTKNDCTICPIPDEAIQRIEQLARSTQLGLNFTTINNDPYASNASDDSTHFPSSDDDSDSDSGYSHDNDEPTLAPAGVTNANAETNHDDDNHVMMMTIMMMTIMMMTTMMMTTTMMTTTMMTTMMMQMMARDVVGEIDYANISKEEKEQALPILLFLTMKQDSNIKGQAYADGRKQQIWTQKEDASSPTIALEALFYTLIVNVMEERDPTKKDGKHNYDMKNVDMLSL